MTDSPVTTAWNALPPSIKAQAERIAGHNRDLTWPEVLLLVGRALMERDPWQPIDSAPTNKAIQILIPNADYYGNDGVYSGMLVDMGTGKRWMTFGWAVGRDLGPDMWPTHWQPLPSPPALDAAPEPGGKDE